MALQQVIAGIDNENQIRLECEITGLYKATSYGAIVDTGFSGGLVLPQVIAVDIGLETVGAGNVTLADGSIRTLPMYMCKVKIGDVIQETDTLVMGNDVLIGMNVIDQFTLIVNGPKGQVSVEGAESAAGIRNALIQNPHDRLVNTLKKLTGR
ncbi:MAG: hypothetical protein PHH85_02110 [Candidatus Methanoperedens sp.]|nr:hypothetical protein [Candidatus Methanoperedens sp.]